MLYYHYYYCITTACSELHKVFLFLVLSVTFLFVCLCMNKFTRNTCLIPHLDKFECQGQRSRSPRTNFLPTENAL